MPKKSNKEIEEHYFEMFAGITTYLLEASVMETSQTLF